MSIKREQEHKETIQWCKSEEHPNLITAKFLQTQQQGRLLRRILWMPRGCVPTKGLPRCAGAERTKLQKVCSCRSSNPSNNSSSSITKTLAHKLVVFAFKTYSFPTYHISFLTEISAPVWSTSDANIHHQLQWQAGTIIFARAFAMDMSKTVFVRAREKHTAVAETRKWILVRWEGG